MTWLGRNLLPKTLRLLARFRPLWVVGAGASVSYWLLAGGCHLRDISGQFTDQQPALPKGESADKGESIAKWKTVLCGCWYPNTHTVQWLIDEKQVRVPAHTKSVCHRQVQCLTGLLASCAFRHVLKLSNCACLKCAMIVYCHSCKGFTNKNGLIS